MGVPLHMATEDGSAGARGRVTDVVGPLLDSGRFQRLCACGPEGMLDSLPRSAAPRQAFPRSCPTRRTCAAGSACAAPASTAGRLVCMDGPVFGAEASE